MTTIQVSDVSVTTPVPVTQYVLDTFDDESNVNWLMDQ